VIEEGVESPAQFEFLTRETVDEVQRYLLGRPYPSSITPGGSAIRSTRRK